MTTLSQIRDAKPDTMVGIIPGAVFDESKRSGHPWAHLEYTWYYAVASVLNSDQILEIGVLTGLSLASMLLGSPESFGVGWDIESYRAGTMDEARSNLKACGVSDRALLVIKDSQKEQRWALPKYDLMHIDGDHSYQGCLNDLNLSVGTCPNVLVDDYDSHPEVRDAVNYWRKWHAKTIKNIVHMPTRNGLVLIQS